MKTPSSTQQLVTALVLAVAAMGQNAIAGDLFVTISGVELPKGDVMIGLFDSETGFPNGSRAASQKVPASTASHGSVQVIFKNLKPGHYALTAYQDINQRGRIEVNMFGMPVVPYGASRDARNSMGPPRFQDAYFVMNDEDLMQSFQIK